MKKRFITGLIMAAVLIPLVSIEVLFELFLVVMSILLVIAVLEMIKMFETKKKFPLAVKIGVIILTLVTFFSIGGIVGVLRGEEANPLAILESTGFLTVTVLLITVICLSFLVFCREFDGEDVGKILTIIFYIGLGFASVMILRILGVRFIVYLLLICFCTDVFAYLFGVKFGKHKMAPNISPKKSWEGAIAGTVFGTVIPSLFAIFYGTVFVPGTGFGDFFNSGGELTLLDNFSSLGQEPLWLQGIIISFITLAGSVIAQLGDLVASKLKRTYEIKDFGHIFPGHGGVLDRFDSIIFVAMFLTGIFLIIYRFAPAVII